MVEQINIREQLPNYINEEVKLLTTRCIIIETEKIAKKTHGALTILKQFGIHDCYHKNPLVGSQCILSMIGNNNENHYLVATQDIDLQNKLRKIPGVPLLYFHHKTPTLEKPSRASNDKAVETRAGNPRLFITEAQNETLQNIKKALGVQENIEESKMIVKKKKTHNPNPLSCKKKKKKSEKSENKIGVRGGKVKKRKKKKLPKHVKEQLSADINKLKINE